MARITHIRPRETHRYVDSCSHLDQWGDDIRIKVLGGKRGFDEDAGRDMAYNGWTSFRVVIKTPGVEEEVVAKALRDTFNFRGCSCIHDCCGCPSAHADIRRVGRNEYFIHQEHHRNY